MEPGRAPKPSDKKNKVLVLNKRKRQEFKPNLIKRRTNKIKTISVEKEQINLDLIVSEENLVNMEENIVEIEDAYSGVGNRFQIMSTQQEEEDIWQVIRGRNKGVSEKSVVKEKPIQKEVNREENGKQQTDTGKEGEQNKQKKERIPPIIIHRQSVEDTIRLVREGLGIVEFKIKRYNNFKHSIFLNSIDNYIKVKDGLKRVEAPHFSFCPKGSRRQTMILKGLDPNTDPARLLAELQHFGVDNLTFLSVKSFETKFSVQNNRKLPMFIVQLSPESQTNNLREIKYINYQVVRWEKFSRKEVLQCRRCQRFGHAASNCCMEYRCVKCAQPHGPGNCPIQGKNEQNLPQMKCALCGNSGHPASYRGCPRYLELKTNLNKKRENLKIQQQQKTQMYANFTNKQFTYADMAKENTQPRIQTQQNTNTPSNDFDDIKKMLLSIHGQLSKFKAMLEEEKSRIDILFDIIGAEEMNG